MNKNKTVKRKLFGKERCIVLVNFSSGKNSLTKKIYNEYWSELKEPFMNSITQTEMGQKRLTSQRQAVIKLIEKKDKCFIKNWRPIPLWNIDCKIISKFSSSRLLKVITLLILSQQTAYVANICIGESRRLLSDLLRVTENFKTKGYLVRIFTEKNFDSLDNTFLLTTLEKFVYQN